MKRCFIVCILMLTVLLLASCAKRSVILHPYDFTAETWPREVNRNPNIWARGADIWFKTGRPNPEELANRRAAFNQSIATLSVKVPNITNIKVRGDFQVQIFGTDGPNSLDVYGPHSAVRSIIIDVKGNNLCINQAPHPPPNMRRAIIRIGVRRLNSLMQMGCGSIEAVRVYSNCLSVVATPLARGNVWISGNVNVTKITQMGRGAISILGGNTRQLAIFSTGLGDVNVCGRVGIRLIVNRGWGNVNIVDARSNNLKIYASGGGKVGVNGSVSLRELIVRNSARVYVSEVNSPLLYGQIYDNGQVGLAGRVQDLNINAQGCSRWLGRFLCSNRAYLKAQNGTQVNLSATERTFASVKDTSKVYFYGPPGVLTSFIKGSGTLVPMWNQGQGPYCA